MNAKAIHHLNLSTGFAEHACFSIMSGARERDSQRRCMLESQLKIYTGREMLRMPLPEKRFFFSVLIMNLITLSWAATLGSLTRISPPPLSNLKSFLKIRLSYGNFFLLNSMRTGEISCLMVR